MATEDEIDDEYLIDIAESRVQFVDGTAEAGAHKMLEAASKRIALAKQRMMKAQQEIQNAQNDGIRAVADRDAAAKLLTILLRTNPKGVKRLTRPSKPPK